jgi:hypothetical protein
MVAETLCTKLFTNIVKNPHYWLGDSKTAAISSGAIFLKAKIKR